MNKKEYPPEVEEIADKAGVLAEEVLEFMKPKTDDMRVALAAIKLLDMASESFQKDLKSRFN